MSDTDEENPSRKRRRTVDDDDGDDESPRRSGNNDVIGGNDTSPVASSQQSRRERAGLLERRAAERRRQRRQAEIRREVAELQSGNIDLDDGGSTQPPTYNDNDDDVDDDIDDDVDQYVPEEEEDGEDLMENAERDYQPIAALDTYGTEGIDDRDFGLMDHDQRHAADAELARRDRQSGRVGRSAGLYGMALDVMETEEDEEARRARRGAFRLDVADDRDGVATEEEDETDEEDLDGDDPINLEAFDVPLREWIAQDRTRREIQRRFRAFLRHFTDDGLDRDGHAHRRRRGNGMYEQKIRAMCAANMSSLQISYEHLFQTEPVLAIWVTEVPRDILAVLNEAATRHTLMLFPHYNAIKTETHVRIYNLPITESLRDLRRAHLDCLVKVHGVVTRRNAVTPQLQLAYYQCLSCNNIHGPFQVDGFGPDAAAANKPDECPHCDENKLKLHPTKSVYCNYQTMNLQETPGSVPPGRVPRTKEIRLTHDLIDVARPGEEIEVTGIFEHKYDASLTFKSGFPVFATFISANHVRKREDASSVSSLSESDVREILKLSRDPKIGDRIVQSIAPSIFGHENCKMALAMSLFGGVPKNINDKHRIRGDVNVLFLGDPGTAKSQLLKYAEKTAPRAVYSAGKGASAVGLTAGVHKDPITKEWTLEGGALVLADKGVALIDEFDKMNEQDRTSIHEAMEQQSISVSKAGIVTSLQARCSVIAAANPIGGRYDSSNTLADNVELTDPILQRFDILCVLQDTVDPVSDERLADFVTSSHMNSVPTSDLVNERTQLPETTVINKPGTIPQSLLRKYIQYARTNARPDLRGNAFDQEKVASLYVALRRESAASGGVPIAVRHLESIMRMAEAHAKMHLRDYVRDDDMDASIRMMLESFIVSQKFSVRRTLRRNFNKYLSTGEDRAQLLLYILRTMFNEEHLYQTIRFRTKNLAPDLLETVEIQLDDFEAKARQRRIYNVIEFCRGPAFAEAGYAFDESRGAITTSVATS